MNLIFISNDTIHAQNKIEENDKIIADTITSIDTSNFNKQNTIDVPFFCLIDCDTIVLGPHDELISDNYSALGKPHVYDALHSFNFRRSDKFGGYINEKINSGLERIRKKGFKSDIKQLYIQIDPLTLTVYWFAVVGPSSDGYSYIRIDSRGSAGGYLKAVEKQLPKMHNLYPELIPVKFLEFNENVIVCYSWDGKSLDNYCSYVNIQQHFFKYRKRKDDEKFLKSESKLDSIFGEEIHSNSDIQDSMEFLNNEENVLKFEYRTNIKKEQKIAKSKTKKYRVKNGDTLSEIAEKNHSSVTKIKKLNQLKSDKLQIGQIIKIPVP